MCAQKRKSSEEPLKIGDFPRLATPLELGGAEPSNLLDRVVGDGPTSVLDELEKTESLTRVADIVNSIHLNNDTRLVLKLSYGFGTRRGKTYSPKQIGETLDVGEDEIKQLHDRGLRTVKDLIEIGKHLPPVMEGNPDVTAFEEYGETVEGFIDETISGNIPLDAGSRRLLLTFMPMFDEEVQIKMIERVRLDDRERKPLYKSNLSKDEERLLFTLLRQYDTLGKVHEGLTPLQEKLHEHLRHYLIEKNMALLYYFGKKRFGYDPDKVDEFVGFASETLINSVDKFDHLRGFKFSTYASNAIQKRMIRFLQQQAKYARVYRESDSDLVDGLSLVPDESPLESDEVTERDFINKMIRLLNSDRFDTRERFILKMRYGIGTKNEEPYVLKDVGEIIHITKERVRQIEAKAERKLQELFEEDKPTTTVVSGHPDVFLYEEFNLTPGHEAFDELIKVDEKKLRELTRGVRVHSLDIAEIIRQANIPTSRT